MTQITDRQLREREFFNMKVGEDRYASWKEFSFEYWANYRAIQRRALDYLGPVQGKRLLLCGVGAEAVLFARAGAEVYGFDISDCQIESVRKLSRRSGLGGRVRIESMPFERMSYPDASFDMAFGDAILHHIDLASGGAELARVLKRGGRASFIEPFGENPLLEFARRHLPYPGKGRTCDEQPLRYADIHKFGAPFAETRLQEYALLSCVRRFLRSPRICGLLENIDAMLMPLIPTTRSLCATVWVGVQA